MKYVRIYISLPISGCNLEERKKKAAQMKDQVMQAVKTNKLAYISKNGKAVSLTESNTVVITPFEIVPDATDMTYEQVMAKDLEVLMTCDIVVFARHWQYSKGCRIEFAVARELGIRVNFEALEVYGEE